MEDRRPQVFTKSSEAGMGQCLERMAKDFLKLLGAIKGIPGAQCLPKWKHESVRQTVNDLEVQNAKDRIVKLSEQTTCRFPSEGLQADDSLRTWQDDPLGVWKKIPVQSEVKYRRFRTHRELR